MAYIVDTVTDLSETDKTSWTINWNDVAHQAGDMLMPVLFLDDDAVTPTGWTGYTSISDRTTQTTPSTFLRLDAYYKIAASSSEGSLTITTGSLNGQLVGYVIRDVDTTTPIEAAAGLGDNTTLPTKVIPTITTTTDNCLIFVFGAMNATAITRWQRKDDAKLGKLLENRQIASEKYYTSIHSQRSAGALPNEDIYTITQRSLFVQFAIKNKVGGNKPIATSGGIDYKFRAGAFDAPTVAALSTRRTTVNALTVSTNTVNVTNTSDFLTDDDTGTCSVVSVTQSGVSNTIQGFVHDIGTLFGANRDMSGPMTFSYRNNGTSSNQDHFVYLEDGSGNWVAKIQEDFGVEQNKNYYYFKAYADFTTYDSGGTIDYTDIKYYGYGFELIGTLTGARNYYHSGVASLTNMLVFTGGGPMAPVNGREIAQHMLYNDAHGTASSAGQAQDIITYGYQLGDGTNATHYIGAGSSVEFPFTQVNYELNDLDLDIELYGSADCIFDYRASITRSTKLNKFTINSLSSTLASYLFGAGIISGFSVTWKTGITCNGATFSNCSEIDAKGGVFNNCTITKTIAGAAEAAIAFDANSSMDGTEIDVTDTAAGYHLELGTAVTAFTLTDVTFTGTPSVDKIHVLATTGTVTITTAGTTSIIASDVTSAGATIVIAGPTPTVTVTVLDSASAPIEGARVYLVESGTSTVVLNSLTNASGIATTSYTGTTPQAVTGWVRKGTTAPLYKQFSLGGSISSSGYDNTAIMTLDT